MGLPGGSLLCGDRALKRISPDDLQAFHEEVQRRYPIIMSALHEAELREAEICAPTRAPTRASLDHCDLCGAPSELDPDVHEATDLNLCTHCVEASL